MAERIYCGYAREVSTKYGGVIKLSLRTEDCKRLKENLSEFGWVNVDVKEKPNFKKGSSKMTHYLEVNTQGGNNYGKVYFDIYDTDDNEIDDGEHERYGVYAEEVISEWSDYSELLDEDNY